MKITFITLSLILNFSVNGMQLNGPVTRTFLNRILSNVQTSSLRPQQRLALRYLVKSDLYLKSLRFASQSNRNQDEEWKRRIEEEIENAKLDRAKAFLGFCGGVSIGCILYIRWVIKNCPYPPPTY